MFILKNEIQFDMAHYLSGYKGKCANIHGHRYRLIVKIISKTLHQEGQLRGMVDDFGNIKKALKEIEDFFDHKLIMKREEVLEKVYLKCQIILKLYMYHTELLLKKCLDISLIC